MRRTNLSSSEIQDLMNRYQSELKKLEFQTAEVIDTIAQLKKWLESVEKNEKKALTKLGKTNKLASAGKSVKLSAKKRRGRPPKKSKKIPGKSVSTPQKRTQEKKGRKGYKLSEWDKLVIESVTHQGKPQITKEIIDYVSSKVKEKGWSTHEEEIKNRVIRSLQKLANRRGEMVKVRYKGKGHAYALPGMAGIKRTIARKPEKKKSAPSLPLAK